VPAYAHRAHSDLNLPCRPDAALTTDSTVALQWVYLRRMGPGGLLGQFFFARVMSELSGSRARALVLSAAGLDGDSRVDELS